MSTINTTQLYLTLLDKIIQHNSTYLAVQNEYQLNPCEATDRARRTHENEYATEISDLIINNVDTLKPQECAVLDLIPYTVWAKMTAKSRIIAQSVINRL